MPWSQDDLNSSFQSSLGRAPSQSEMDFLKPYLDMGHISPYEIGQYLGGTPEAQKTRLGQQQSQYGSILSQNNSTILNQAADRAQSQFAQNGRQWSSGQGNSILQAGQQLAAQQSPMLANFYGQGQMGLNSQYAQAGGTQLGRAYGLADQYRQRVWNQQDYQQQKSDYNDYLRGQQTRNMQMGVAQGIFGGINSGVQAYGRGQANNAPPPSGYV